METNPNKKLRTNNADNDDSSNDDDDTDMSDDKVFKDHRCVSAVTTTVNAATIILSLFYKYVMRNYFFRIFSLSFSKRKKKILNSRKKITLNAVIVGKKHMDKR